ncbi:diguanylate cyclase [Vibrio viridaestus]|nr:diguanylate cyclase [Vibrio viridaestus]
MAYENVLNSSTDSVIIIHSGQYLKTLRQIEHPSNLAAAFPAADWKDIGHKTLNLGSYSGFTWVKFTVSTESDLGHDKWVLNIPWPTLNFLEIYTYDTISNTWQFINRVDHWQTEKDSINSIPFSMEVDLPAASPITFFLQLKGSDKTIVPITLTKQVPFEQHNHRLQFLYGGFFGILLAILAYNLIIAIYLKSKSYAFYCGYILCLIGYTLFISGIGTAYIWHHFAWINQYAFYFFISCAFLSAALFIKSFLQLNRYRGWPNLLANMVIVSWIFIALITLAFKSPLFIYFADFMGIVSCLTVLLVSVYCWYKGDAAAKFLLFAWCIVILATFYLMLCLIGYTSYTPIALHIQFVGFVIEVFLLSMALAYRIKMQRLALLDEQKKSIQLTMHAKDAKEKEVLAQQRALVAERNARIELEAKVMEKTKELKLTLIELEDANKELHQLSQTDGLTALSNRRHLDTTLPLLAQQSSLTDTPLCVLMIDIDHFKMINDQYGHLCGDDCIRFVANIIKQHKQEESDVAVRYGGEEFCLIFLQKNKQSIINLAEQIRITIEQQSSSEQQLVEQGVRFTVSIGVSCGKVSDLAQAHQLLKSADAALYEAKQTGRNKVVSA